MSNISTNFFVLMSYKFMPGKSIAWNNPDALCYLGIPCRPSAVRSDPIPPRLNHTSSSDISDLIAATTSMPNVNKARQFIESEKSPKFNKGRAALVEWYCVYISHQVNKCMTTTMVAAQCMITELLNLQEDDSYPQTSAFNVNDIGTELIGGVICNGKVVSSSVAPLIKGLIMATLGRIRKHYNKGQVAILGKKVPGGRDLETSMWLKMLVLMKDLMQNDNGEVEGKDVMKAIENIKLMSKHICWVPTKMPVLEEWRSFLKGLGEAMELEVEFEPATAETDAQVDKIEKARSHGSWKKICAETMSERDLKLLYDTLVDHFANSQTSVALNPLDEDDDVADLYNIFNKDGGDMGVTKFRLEDQKLIDLLDFPGGRPVLFPKYRHRDTMKTPWDSPDDRMWEVGEENLQPLRLLWHQLCGVASLVDGVFQRPGTSMQNRLLADDVGIGKCAQVMGLIVFLILVWYMEKEGKAHPPIIVDAERVFMSCGPVPSQLHLLVIPNSLVPQWTWELKTFFNPKQIEIHQLPTSEALVEAYLQSDAWVKSEVPTVLRIVIVSHTVHTS